MTSAADVNELIPAEVLWASKNNVDNSQDVVSSNRVDFDSYLAETEELIAQAGQHPKKEADGYVNSSQQHSGGSSSRFILLDSGGWQEVIIRQPVSPDEQQQDVTLD